MLVRIHHHRPKVHQGSSHLGDLYNTNIRFCFVEHGGNNHMLHRHHLHGMPYCIHFSPIAPQIRQLMIAYKKDGARYHPIYRLALEKPFKGMEQ